MESSFVQMLYSALVIGAVYALMAMGFTLIYGGVRLLNMAHGALFMVGGYTAYALVVVVGLPVFVGPIVGFIVAAIFSSLAYQFLLRPVMRKPDWENRTIALGLGISVVMGAAIILIFGAREKPLPTLIPGRIPLPAGVVATGEGLLMFGVSVGCLLALAYFLSQSRYGVGIRALASNTEGAQILGVNVERLTLTVMILGGGLAGLAGVLYASFYFLSATAGFDALVKALIVTVVGGLGNLRGTIAAAFLVGLLESAVSVWLGSNWTLPVLFASLAVLLVVRPSGLFSPKGQGASA